MAFTSQPAVIGVQAKFFPDGLAFTLPSAGTASKSALPGAADTAWIQFGMISEAADTPTQDEIDVFAPKPGRKRLVDVLPTKDQRTFKFTVQELSPFVLQSIFKTGTLTGSSSTFDPHSGVPQKGWLLVERYNQADQKLYTTTEWVYLKVTGDVTYGDQLASVEFEARILDNDLAVGALP